MNTDSAGVKKPFNMAFLGVNTRPWMAELGFATWMYQTQANTNKDVGLERYDRMSKPINPYSSYKSTFFKFPHPNPLPEEEGIITRTNLT